jgi:hypothetical protein
MPDPLALVVNGGRDYADGASLFAALDSLHAEPGGVGVVIDGGAEGADALARRWAVARGVPVVTVAADWSLGRKAGPLRNRAMIERVRTDPRPLLVSFPGGKGTHGTRAIAAELGVPVRLPAGR